MSQLHIDEVIPKENMNPMLLNFQNGNITEQFTPQECMVFCNTENDKKTVATVIDGIVYAGEENLEELGKTFILARNKKTGHVRLIETGAVNMKPLLEAKVSTSQVPETSNLELSRKFGSKKQKQKMEYREKLKVNVETVTEQMQNVTQEMSKDDLDLSSYDKKNADDFYIPPIDRAADAAEKVYDIDKILTQAQYEKIISELEEKDYTSDMIPLVKNIATKVVQPKLKVLAVYANSLFQLYNTVVREILKKTFVICPHSITLNNIILTDFLTSPNGKRARPAPYKDKSLCHAMVFLLLINNLKFELDSLCEAVKLAATTASLKVRVTGASIVTTGNKKIVQLKLPLNKKLAFARRKSTRF